MFEKLLTLLSSRLDTWGDTVSEKVVAKLREDRRRSTTGSERRSRRASRPRG